MSFMPPEEPMSPLSTGPADTPDIDTSIEKAVGAMNAVADNAANSQDPEAAQRFGDAFHSFAQGVQALLTPPPDPAKVAQTKAEADMVRAGAQLAHDEAKADADRKATQNGGKDGQGTADSQRR